MNSFEIEFCADGLKDLEKACLLGIDRVELCSNLDVGGLSVDKNILKEAVNICRKYQVEVFPMIRSVYPRFYYTDADINIMKQSVLEAKECAVDGIVFGALNEVDGAVIIDRDAVNAIKQVSGNMKLVFHMAFDYIIDWKFAIDQLVDLGFMRILTHGSNSKKEVDINQLKQYVRYAKGRIQIMAGGSVTYQNYNEIVSLTGVNAVHGTKIVDLS